MSEQLETGLALAMKLFAGLESSGPPLPDQFQKYTFEHLFGDVWQAMDAEASAASGPRPD